MGEKAAQTAIYVLVPDKETAAVLRKCGAAAEFLVEASLGTDDGDGKGAPHKRGSADDEAKEADTVETESVKEPLKEDQSEGPGSSTNETAAEEVASDGGDRDLLESSRRRLRSLEGAMNAAHARDTAEGVETRSEGMSWYAYIAQNGDIQEAAASFGGIQETASVRDRSSRIPPNPQATVTGAASDNGVKTGWYRNMVDSLAPWVSFTGPTRARRPNEGEGEAKAEAEVEREAEIDKVGQAIINVTPLRGRARRMRSLLALARLRKFERLLFLDADVVLLKDPRVELPAVTDAGAADDLVDFTQLGEVAGSLSAGVVMGRTSSEHFEALVDEWDKRITAGSEEWDAAMNAAAATAAAREHVKAKAGSMGGVTVMEGAAASANAGVAAANSAAAAFVAKTFNDAVSALDTKGVAGLVNVFPPTLTPNGYFGLLIRRAPEWLENSVLVRADYLDTTEKKREMLRLRGLWFTNLAVDFDPKWSDRSFTFRSVRSRGVVGTKV